MYKQYSCKKKNKKIILTHIHISFTHEMSFCHVCSLSIIISQKWERKKLSDNTLYNKPGQRILLKKEKQNNKMKWKLVIEWNILEFGYTSHDNIASGTKDK